jgi:predicted phosphodiesterase
MVASVAVLSDIHGVLPALEAVLAEPEVGSAERIVLTGDIAAGPQPVEVLDPLLDLGDRVSWVRGNADRELVELARGVSTDSPDPITSWAATQLRVDHVDWLAQLPHPILLNIDGFGDVLFCHGTPRDDNEVVVVDTRLDRWAEVLADLPATFTPSFADILTCPSCGSPMAARSSIPAASACPTAAPVRIGPS